VTKPTVLVVDDEESMRYFLTRALKRKGYEVTVAPTGGEALETLAEEPRDLVLLDLKLPDVDGIELLGKIRELRPEAAVVMMTGFGTVERALEAMRRGAADFVTKPFRVEQVLGKLEAARAAPRTTTPERPDPPPRPAGAGGQAVPPRALTAFLIEAAERRGIEPPEGGDLPYREASKLFEALFFTELFERTEGNVSMAARIAGISRPSLHRKIQELKIDVDAFRR